MTLFHMSVQAGEDAGKGALPSRAKEAVSVARRGDLKSALLLAQQAWQAARELKDERAVLEATHAASIVHMIRGDSISAVAAATDAFDLARRLGDASLEGHARVSLCFSGAELGTHEDAERDLGRCIEQAVAAHDSGLEIRARVALGIVLGDRGRFELAPAQFQRALALAEDHPGFTPPGCIAVNLANVHRKCAALHVAAGRQAQAEIHIAEALRVSDQAFRLSLEEEAVPACVEALGIRACALEMLGARDKALALLAYAVSIGVETRSRTAVLWVLCELGRVRVLASELDAARAAYTQALDAASGLRPCATIHIACAGLADVEGKLGRDAAAADWRARADSEKAEFERWRRDSRWQLARLLS